jgi:outer membrane lipoprotein SlyB
MRTEQENQNMHFWKTAKLGVAIGMVAYLTSACATKTQSGALVGAGAGGLVGAGIGALAGGGKGAVVGGAIGAAAGAGTGALIGNYMDKQEKALKEVKGANVERQGDQLVVKFNSAILFDTGKSNLKPSVKERPDRIRQGTQGVQRHRYRGRGPHGQQGQEGKEQETFSCASQCGDCVAGIRGRGA